MQYPKNKRAKNPKLLQAIRQLPCVACGKAGPSDPDHIGTKGAGHGDADNNLWPLCRMDHRMKHDKGLSYFVGFYPHLVQILKNKGWTYDDFSQRWICELYSNG